MLIVDAVIILAVVGVLSAFFMGLFKPIFLRWLEYHERREQRLHAAKVAKDADEVVKLLMLEPELAKDVSRKISQGFRESQRD